MAAGPSPATDSVPFPTRIFAIDWSGARTGAERTIWLAEVANGAVRRLENGRDRDEIADFLLAERERDPHFIAGFDFAFSLPEWFLDGEGLVTAPDLWARAAREADAWLTACRPPFWGRPGTKKPLDVILHRRTELLIPPTAGISPKSVFQIGGAGAVGTGSLRGLAILHRLHAAGFAVWPYTPSAWPCAVEIYPRLLTGPVTKSRVENRAAYLHAHFPDLPAPYRERAAGSEDAFDALVSALRMDRQRTDLAALPTLPESWIRREGLVWFPGWAAALAGAKFVG